jgi:predicted GTPase
MHRLLNYVQDVKDNQAGSADINHGITTEHNKHLILHDSQGYEPGDEKKFKVLENFIVERSLKKHVGDRIHAIW